MNEIKISRAAHIVREEIHSCNSHCDDGCTDTKKYHGDFFSKNESDLSKMYTQINNLKLDVYKMVNVLS